MPELSLPYQYYTITVTDFNTFLLNVDTRNFAAGTVGTGGSATHVPYSSERWYITMYVTLSPPPTHKYWHSIPVQ